MPSLGADMETGTVVKWLVAPGDPVHRGDIVAIVETEKSTIDAEIFADGVVDRLLVGEGERVPVGTPLATLLAPGAKKAPPTAPPAQREAPKAAEATTERAAPASHPAEVHSPLVRRLAGSLGVDLATVRGSGPGGSVTREDVETAARAAPPRRRHERASPLARRRAHELGIELASVTGTGPEGAITLDDVEGAHRTRSTTMAGTAAGEAGAAGAGPEAGGEGGAPAKRTAAQRQAAMRQSIAALMSRSKREIPHYYLHTTIDFSRSSSWLQRENLTRPPDRRLLPAALLLKASALAAREIPEMNGFFVDDEFVPSTVVHLGVAISLRQGGLIAPAIHDVDRLSLEDLMVALKDLVARARTGRLRSSEMSDPTLTVTNLGDQGVDTVFGVIYPPQVALVGFGRISKRPWAADEMIGVRPLLSATLAADHRVSDGHRGARFLTAIDHLVQQPEQL